MSVGEHVFDIQNKSAPFHFIMTLTLTNEKTVYSHVTCSNNFGPYRNFAVWKQTAPRIKSNIVTILIPVSEQSNRSTCVKAPLDEQNYAADYHYRVSSP